MKLNNLVLLFLLFALVPAGQGRGQDYGDRAYRGVAPALGMQWSGPAAGGADWRLQNAPGDSVSGPEYGARAGARMVMRTQDLMMPTITFPVPASRIPFSGRAEAESARLTPLEKAYSERAGTILRQFGYDRLMPAEPAGTPHADGARSGPGRTEGRRSEDPPVLKGAVSGNYTLGPGDRVRVRISGPAPYDETLTVGAQGKLHILDWPPLPAAGRSLTDLRAEIGDLAQSRRTGARAFVSLAELRQIQVAVTGYARRPGRVSLSPMAGIADALREAAGVAPAGSLRNIMVIRDGELIRVDLYPLLSAADINDHARNNAGFGDLQLRDGDRIVIPALGPSYAVAGEVQSPGIYELPPAGDGETLAGALARAGGVTAPGQTRLSLLVSGKHGDVAGNVIDPARRIIPVGGIIKAQRAVGRPAGGQVILSGSAVREPGSYPLIPGMTLADLLAPENRFAAELYPLFALILRQRADLAGPELVPFSPMAVRSGRFDLRLQERDRLRFLTYAEVQDLLHSAPLKQAAGRAATPRGGNADSYPGQSNHDPSNSGERGRANPLRDVYFNTTGGGENGRYPGAGGTGQQAAGSVFADRLRVLLKAHVVDLEGAVVSPGRYPAVPPVTLQDLWRAAGGLRREADANRVEVLSAESFTDRTGHHSGTQARQFDLSRMQAGAVALNPGDHVRVTERFDGMQDGAVHILGAVRYPGRYALVRGERMSDLLARAGGLTQNAYPEGVVFSRAEERARQKVQFETAARALETTLARQLTSTQERGRPSGTDAAMIRNLAEELRRTEPLGRMTVEADPAVLSANPDQDVLLEAGDRIHIPKRPFTVRVSGEVHNPASLQYKPGQTPYDYIQAAGGPTRDADAGRAYVVFPDGSAMPVKSGPLRHSGLKIPPGSSIIIPRDPEPFDFVKTAVDLSGVLLNVATSSLFFDDLGEGGRNTEISVP